VGVLLKVIYQAVFSILGQPRRPDALQDELANLVT
jgi:hypothetical protein